MDVPRGGRGSVRNRRLSVPARAQQVKERDVEMIKRAIGMTTVMVVESGGRWGELGGPKEVLI